MRHTLLPLLALLVGCPAGPTDKTGGTGATSVECTLEPWFADADGDGWGDAAAITLSCEPVLHAVQQVGDCDDDDPLVHPDAPDLDCDQRDDDCDGVADQGASLTTWYADQDGDGVGGPASIQTCATPAGFVELTGDCDDGDIAVYPGAPEVCNGADDDCDGVVPPTEIDGDGDGWATCEGDCDDADSARHPGATELCNGLDDDCDTAIPLDEFDLDSDGGSTCEGDCDDGDPLVGINGVELAADGVDGDCDGLELCWLDGDGDGDGGFRTVLSTDLLCDGPLESDNRDDCDDNDPYRSGSGVELPYDGLDNDCDPATRDDDLDGDGFVRADDCDDSDPAVSPANPPDVVFVDRTAAAGLAVRHWDPIANPLTACPERMMTAGASAADYDGDGWIDLFLPRQFARDQLFHNNGDGTFTDVAVASGIDVAGSTSMGLFADLDRDGDLDLFTVSAGEDPNRLFLNDGDGTFTLEPGARGMELPLAPGACATSFGAVAADVDGDGDLDVHTQQWMPDGTPGDRSRLFLNDGAGNFTDGTIASGLDLSDRSAFASAFSDLDDDGDLDLALAADWGDSGLWLNDGTGAFTEVTIAAGVGTDENGMGSALADIDGDGDLDWFVTAIWVDDPVCDAIWGCTGNRLYRNDGGASFTDITDAAGVRDGQWGWGAAAWDFDHDGDLDLGQANGFPPPTFDDDPNRLFVNDGTGTFDERACEHGLAHQGQGKAFLPFDADNDGDLDLFTTDTVDEPRLLWNEGADARSWLRVQASEPGNAFGIGARIEVQAVSGGPVTRGDITANSTYSAMGPLEAHFGLAGHEGPIHEVRVRWPDGGTTVLSGVTPRQLLAISRS